MVYPIISKQVNAQINELNESQKMKKWAGQCSTCSQLSRKFMSYDTEGNMSHIRRLSNNTHGPFLSLQSTKSNILSKSCFLRTGASSNLPYGPRGHSVGFQWSLCLHSNACTFLYTTFLYCIRARTLAHLSFPLEIIVVANRSTPWYTEQRQSLQHFTENAITSARRRLTKASFCLPFFNADHGLAVT